MTDSKAAHQLTQAEMTDSKVAHQLTQEDDNPNVPKLVAVAVATLVVFAGGILYVIVVLRQLGTPPDRLGGPVPKQTGRPEIGIVDQPLFENDRRLEDLTAAKRRWLDEYGWTDRDAGTIHVPVARSVEEMLKGQRSR